MDNPLPLGDRSRRDIIWEAALLASCGKSIKDIAAACSVTPRTVYRWYRSRPFQEALTRFRTILMNSVLGELISNNQRAVATMVELLVCDQPAVRLGAAARIVSLTLAARDQVELAGQVERLQDEMAQLRKRLEPINEHANGSRSTRSSN